jgi:hypothetical protein
MIKLCEQQWRFFLFSLKTVVDNMFSKMLNIRLKSFNFTLPRIYTDANMAAYFVKKSQL